MNDVLIKNENTVSDNSTCGLCCDVNCSNTCDNFSYCSFYGEVKKGSNNVDYCRQNNDRINANIYNKNSLRKYLMGNISEESVVLPNNSDNDCLICYDERGVKPVVICSLCSKFVHYKCYKKFTEKNSYYTMKCIQCGTRSLQFSKKWWQWWCCFD